MSQIPAIDVHAHYGRSAGTKPAQVHEFESGDAAEVVRRARLAGVRLTIVSPLTAVLPRGGADPVAGNDEAARVVADFPELLQWVVVDPLKPKTYEQAAALLGRPKCAGMKIHPEEHRYPINDHGRKIFEFAEKHHAIIETHSGEQQSLPSDFVKFANDFPTVRLILSHLGCGWDGDLSHQVRAIQQSRHGNIFTDTSSARSITPNLIEWAVREIGADHILFGTDTPLYFTPMQRARIDHADLRESEKRLILHDNAAKLFGV